jgi:hypothetical protein
MKLYLAGGMGVMNVLGRENEVCQMMPTWKRLFSYHYKELIFKSQILNIHRNANNQQKKLIRGTRNSKARACQ